MAGGHVLVVSPVTCGISIIYRTSREPPTQNKDIFRLLNALLSVELNVRHYASNFILFQLKWWIVVKNRTISIFFQGSFGYRNGPFQIFLAMAHGFPSMIHPWFMDFHTLPMSWAMPWRAMNHGWIMDGGPWRDNLGYFGENGKEEPGKLISLSLSISKYKVTSLFTLRFEQFYESVCQNNPEGGHCESQRESCVNLYRINDIIKMEYRKKENIKETLIFHWPHGIAIFQFQKWNLTRLHIFISKSNTMIADKRDIFRPKLFYYMILRLKSSQGAFGPLTLWAFRVLCRRVLHTLKSFCYFWALIFEPYFWALSGAY